MHFTKPISVMQTLINMRRSKQCKNKLHAEILNWIIRRSDTPIRINFKTKLPIYGRPTGSFCIENIVHHTFPPLPMLAFIYPNCFAANYSIMTIVFNKSFAFQSPYLCFLNLIWSNQYHTRCTFSKLFTYFKSSILLLQQIADKLLLLDHLQRVLSQVILSKPSFRQPISYLLRVDKLIYNSEGSTYSSWLRGGKSTYIGSGGNNQECLIAFAMKAVKFDDEVIIWNLFQGTHLITLLSSLQ